MQDSKGFSSVEHSSVVSQLPCALATGPITQKSSLSLCIGRFAIDIRNSPFCLKLGGNASTRTLVILQFTKMEVLVSANSIAAIDGKKEKKGSGMHHIHYHDKSCMFELLVVVLRCVIGGRFARAMLFAPI